MSATNTTTNLGLSQFVNTDVPAWRQDYNGDMLKIDNAYTADISSATAETSADPSDYMKFYDVSATTNKKILISDLLKGAKVEDLTDTDITTPIEDDGLVYDATAQKWENKQITTKEQWKKNGAYNICPNNMTTHITDGITYTVRSDGFTEVSGTASQNTIAYLFNTTGYLVPNSDDVALVGCPTGGGENTYQVLAKYKKRGVAGTQFARCYGANAKLTNVEYIDAVAIAIQSGVTITTPILFKTTITSDLNATYDDCVPYAKTNRELTDLKTDNALLWTDPSNISSISSFASINDGFWNIGSADVARMTDKPTGMSDTKVYIICRNDGSSSLFNILISPKDNHVYVRFKYTSSWSSWVTIA